MDCDRAQELAIEALFTHHTDDDVSLFDAGWTFSWSKRKRAAGHVMFSTRTLYLSREFVRINEEHIIRDVILHEIAHALVGPGHGHGRAWKAMARAVGARPRACVDSSAERVPAAWEGVCEQHGKVSQMHRAPGRVRSCVKCSPRFSARNIIQWQKNGKPVPHDKMPSAKYRNEHSRLMARMELLQPSL